MSKPSINVDELTTRMPYLGLPIVDSVTEAIKRFDDAIGESDGLWALLLDEFEVAPEILQREMLTRLRATTSQKLIFKIALAPCGPHTLIDINEATKPTRENDYVQVDLWYADKGNAENFCEQIFNARQAKSKWHNLPANQSAVQVFGESGYAIVDETGDSPSKVSYGRGAAWTREFSQLVQKDPTFAEFLKNREIDPEKLDPSSQSQSGSTIRKIAPLVAFRNAYKGIGEGKKRGRKPFKSAYSGWAAICAMSEGNPRWLIGMINGIVAKQTATSNLPLPVVVQQNQLMSMSHAFAEILKTVATSQLRALQTNVAVFDTLEKIGEYFHNRLVLDKFVEDPPLSFWVDNDVSEEVEKALRIAINHGALVCYESTDGLGGYKTLRGKRFRLAYLLAPVFKLPLRKSKVVNLSSALAIERNLVPENVTIEKPQIKQLEQGLLQWD
jgi:hypothetical protein